jgi:predicted ATPase
MITKMQVERFRAISDVTVRLGSFNVLIGPNDQGKTSFLEAVYALAATTRNPIAESFWSPWRGRNLVHRGDSKGIRLSASLGGADCPEGSLDYSLTVRPQGDTCTIAQETVGPNGPVLLMQNGADTICAAHRSTRIYCRWSKRLPASFPRRR